MAEVKGRKLVKVANLNEGLSFSVLDSKLKQYGQLAQGKYDKIKLLWIVNINDPSTFLDIEAKMTNDGTREFYVLKFRDPNNPKIERNLIISGDETSETFELWDATCNVDFEVNGITVKKGTKKVRCYAVNG